jgi:hypothetical protein
MNRRIYDELVTMICGLTPGYERFYEATLIIEFDGYKVRVDTTKNEIVFLKHMGDWIYVETDDVSDEMRIEAARRIAIDLDDGITMAMENIEAYVDKLMNS